MTASTFLGILNGALLFWFVYMLIGCVCGAQFIVWLYLDMKKSHGTRENPISPWGVWNILTDFAVQWPILFPPVLAERMNRPK